MQSTRRACIRLLLAIGSERYVPYRARPQPQELLTTGQRDSRSRTDVAGQVSIDRRGDDDPQLDVEDEGRVLASTCSRASIGARLALSDASTTIDTLDYSGDGLNRGSKVVIAAVGPPRRELACAVPSDFSLPAGFSNPKIALPGVLVIKGPRIEPQPSFDSMPKLVASAMSPHHTEIESFASSLASRLSLNSLPLVVIVDDSEFTAASLHNFLWVSFTRSNPAADIYGVGAFTLQKHWGCTGPLVIDARIKPHHAPPLIEDPVVTKKVDALAARGGSLAKWL
jgi:4-hydroxy-3-polyprenylbenzoate decarboxylase